MNSSIRKDAFRVPISTQTFRPNLKRNRDHYNLNNTTRRNIIESLIFNSRGFISQIGPINDIIEKYDVTVIIEHWQTNESKFKRNIRNNEMQDIFFEAAAKNRKRGRGKGGTAIVVKKKLNAIGYFISNRVGVVKVDNLAIIVVYLPYESKAKDNRSDLELEYIACVEQIKNHYNELQ